MDLWPRRILHKFRSLNKHPIKRYARDAQGRTLMIDEESDIELRTALDRVWGKAFQQYKSTLESADIENDYTYRIPLRLKTS